MELERIRLETKEVRERRGRPDPKLQRLEAENGRLRDELARARADRDELEFGLREAVDRLRRG